jgi:short-subunit dehydrogenase
VLVNRNREKTEKLTEELLLEFNGLSVETVIADLEDKFSVQIAAQQLCERDIDILIHNAGVYAPKLRTTNFGYNNVFTVNFISAYYITKKLLTVLRNKKDSKVVVVGSIAHAISKSRANDPDFSVKGGNTNIYGNSKRYLMFSLEQLLKNSGVDYAIAHPGITPTNITSNFSKGFQRFIEKPMKMLFINPETAAKNVEFAVINSVESGFWVGPRVLDVWGLPDVKILKTAKPEEIDRIYKLAEIIYNEQEGY